MGSELTRWRPQARQEGRAIMFRFLHLIPTITLTVWQPSRVDNTVGGVVCAQHGRVYNGVTCLRNATRSVAGGKCPIGGPSRENEKDLFPANC